MVHDPNNSCYEGDVVSIRSGWRTSKNVRHVVTSIIAPMGPPLSERPSVPTEAERLGAKEKKRAEKDLRQMERGRRVSAERVQKRVKLEMRVAHEALVERRKKEEEERIARQLAEGKEPDEEMIRLEEALGKLKKEKTAERMKKLAEARVLCMKMYEEMDGKQRLRMRKLDWMVTVLNDASPFAAIMDMMQNGKSKEEIVAQNVKPGEYDDAECVAKQILSQAHSHLAKQSAVWKRAAQAIAAREKVAGMNDNAKEKIAVYGLSIEDLKQPSLPESRMAAQKLLDAVILLPGIESIGPQTSFQQRISQAQEMLPQFVKQARELRKRIASKSDVNNTSFDSAILDAATAHYIDMAFKLKMKIAQLKRFKGFMEKYPGARAIPKFNIVVQRMSLSKNEVAAARKEFTTSFEKHEGTKVTVETGEIGGNAANVAKQEVDAMHNSSTQQRADVQATVLHEGVEPKEVGNGNLERDGKESSMSSDLPEVKHSNGPVSEWTHKNEVKAMDLEDDVLKNEGQITELDTRNECKEKVEKEGKEKNGGGVFGWFRRS
jgi:small subunit ribosomal protein S17